MIYANIKKIADKKGISIYQIERGAGIANASIRKWGKSANQTPSVITLKKVADYLQVDMNDLLTEREAGK